MWGTLSASCLFITPGALQTHFQDITGGGFLPFSIDPLPPPPPPKEEALLWLLASDFSPLHGAALPLFPALQTEQ